MFSWLRGRVVTRSRGLAVVFAKNQPSNSATLQLSNPLLTAQNTAPTIVTVHTHGNLSES